MASHLSSPLSRSMETAAGDLDGPIDVNELLHLICLAAIDNVRGADYAGITLADRHGKLDTPAQRIRSSTRSTRCNTSTARARASTPSEGGGRRDRTTCASTSDGPSTARWPPISASCRRWGSNCSMNRA